jgi:hypothetical protein
VEAWAIAGIGYIALVAAMRALTPGFVERQARLLGFSRPAREADVAPGEIADIATRGEEPVAEEAPQKPAERPEVAPL